MLVGISVLFDRIKQQLYRLYLGIEKALFYPSGNYIQPETIVDWTQCYTVCDLVLARSKMPHGWNSSELLAFLFLSLNLVVCLIKLSFSEEMAQWPKRQCFHPFQHQLMMNFYWKFERQAHYSPAKLCSQSLFLAKNY